MKSKESRRVERMGFRERICKVLDIQPDIFDKDTLIELRSRNKVTVRGKAKILSYSPTAVRLQTGNGELCIDGKRLFCSSYSKSFIEINGLISAICFREESR